MFTFNETVPRFDVSTLTTPLQLMNGSIPNTVSESLLPSVNATSIRGDCIQIRFSDMEFMPSNNPDNVVSAEVEFVVRMIKHNLLVLLFLIGGPANVINMAVFYRQGLRDRVNLCLFALSLADELHLASSVLLAGEQLYLQFTTKDTFGPMRTFLVNNNFMVLLAFQVISPLLSTVIATERCLCVVNPIQFQTLLRTTTMAAVITVTYIVVIALRFVVVFRYRIGCAFDPVAGVVVQMPIESKFFQANREFLDSLENVVFGVGIPGLVTVVVTAATIITVVKLRQAMTWRSGTSSSISAQEVALTRMLVGSSILFLVCTSPIALTRVIRLFYPEVSHGRRNHNLFYTLISLCLILTYVNATFNVIVYYLMGSRYRETFWALFSPPCRGKSTKRQHLPNSKQTIPRSS